MCAFKVEIERVGRGKEREKRGEKEEEMHLARWKHGVFCPEGESDTRKLKIGRAEKMIQQIAEFASLREAVPLCRAGIVALTR